MTSGELYLKMDAVALLATCLLVYLFCWTFQIKIGFGLLLVATLICLKDC